MRVIRGLRTDCSRAVRSFAADGSALWLTLILGVGVGLLTTMFCLADVYLFRPLPYVRPNELARITVDARGLDAGDPVPTLASWQARTDLFSGLATYEGGPAERLRVDVGAVFLATQYVSPGFLTVLDPSSERLPGLRAPDSSSPVPVVLTPIARTVVPNGLATVGTTLVDSSGSKFVVQSLLPPSFLFPDQYSRVHALISVNPEFVTAVAGRGTVAAPRGVGRKLIARVQLGVTPERIVRELSQTLPSGRRLAITVEWLNSVLVGSVRPLAQGVFVAGVLVLLLCLGNATNLMVFRRLHRAPQLQVRRALGAGAFDLIRLVLAEAIVLAGAASAAALFVATASLGMARVVLPDRFTSLGHPTMSLRAIIFTCAITFLVVFTATLLAEIGKFPRVTSLNVGRSAAGIRDARRFRVVLGGIQAALAVIFAVGAVTLIRSYINLVRQDQGFGLNVSSATVNYPFSRPRAGIFHTVMDTLVSLRRVPDVAMVGATTGPMVNGTYSQRAVTVDGQEQSADWTEVTPGFFVATGMTILAGRPLDNRDEVNDVAVVNDVFARKYWSGTAIGKVLTAGTQTFRVVGVVRGVFDKRLDERPTPTVYAPLTPDSTFPIVTFVLSSATGRELQDLGIRRAIGAVDRDAVVQSVDTVRRRLSRTVADTAFATYLLGVFGLVSVSVTVVGLLAVVSFSAARRRRELAVRAALGAPPRRLQWLVVSEAVQTAVVGSAAGLLIAHVLSNLLESFVYEVTPGSWATLVLVTALSVSIKVTAALVAARGVMRTPPSEALRLE